MSKPLELLADNQCNYGNPLPPGETWDNYDHFFLTGKGTLTGTRYHFRVVVTPTDASDPKPANNTDSISFIVYGSSPDQPTVHTATATGASGTALGPGKSVDMSRLARKPGLQRIEVAILNVSQKGKCSWAKSTSGGFTPQRPNNSCDAPIWLTATGTRTWSLRLARRLPRGRYEFIARALDKAGGVSWPFSSRSEAALAVR